MNPVQVIQSFLKIGDFQNAPVITLKPGQLVYGRVSKFLPNDAAIVQIGDVKLIAQLKASLSIKEQYLFEVQPNGDDGIQLKVVAAEESQYAKEAEHFQLPETKSNALLLHSLVEKNLPITKEQMMLVTTLLVNPGDLNELTAIEWMIKRNLPLTRLTFESLMSVQNSKPFSEQLQEASRFLDNPKFDSIVSIEALKQSIATILSNSFRGDLPTGDEVKKTLQDMVQILGLEYEKEIGELETTIPHFSLKLLLMNAIHELKADGKVLEPILNRLTGMQLLSQDFTGPAQQIVMQLPFLLGDKQTDVTLHWSGRKTSSGKIDADYCRILFYLDLQSIDQTVIDMQVQNRVVHISVQNDSLGIEPIISALGPVLKKKLEGLGYNLSFIKVIPSIEMKSNESKRGFFSETAYQGVDIKI